MCPCIPTPGGLISVQLCVHYGKDAGAEYVTGTRKNVVNKRPIIGQYGVNHEGSADMYYKGANMLHTIRQVVDNDDLWREMLRGMNADFRHETVTTHQVETYISDAVDRNLKPIFDQYLRDVRIPMLQYYWEGNVLNYQWVNTVPGFDLPVKVWIGDEDVVLHPTTSWARLEWNKGEDNVEIDKDYYVTGKAISPPQ